MPAPISVQLYSIREAAAQDYRGSVQKIADFGYVGVEPAGYPGTDVHGAAALYQELGLQVSSAHLPLPVGENRQRVIDEAAVLGITRVVSGFGRDHFKTRDLIKQTCEQFNEAGANARAAGLTFGIHNHWWEFIRPEDGEDLTYQYMLQELEPDVFFEVDTYWVQTGGADPAAVVKELGARAPLLHIKDGPCVQDEPMTAVGEGKVDFHAIVEAAGDNCEWLIVELDRCATDMFEAVKKSIDYLAGEGLGRRR